MHTDSYLEDGDVVPVRPAVCGRLQAVLVDLIELHVQAKHAHWNLVGPGFRSLHLELDDVADAARDASDLVAERMRTLGGVADGRSATVSSTTRLPAFPDGTPSVHATRDLVVDRLGAAVATIRAAHTGVDALDRPSADLLNGIVLDLEKARWMLLAGGASRQVTGADGHLRFDRRDRPGDAG